MSGQEPYWIIGTTWIPKEDLPEYARSITAFRLQYKIWGEMKWSKLTAQKLGEYKEFLSRTFVSFPMCYSGMIVPKAKVDLRQHPGGEPEALAKFSYLRMKFVIKHWYRSKGSYHILIDAEDWSRDHTLNLQEFLRNYLDAGGGGVDHLATADSRINSALQACDIVTGAINSSWRQNNLPLHQRTIVDFLERTFDHKLSEVTSPGRKHFSLWLWRPAAGFSPKVLREAKVSVSGSK